VSKDKGDNKTSICDMWNAALIHKILELQSYNLKIKLTNLFLYVIILQENIKNPGVTCYMTGFIPFCVFRRREVRKILI